MTSLVFHPNHDCAPHAMRTLAMACAMALNLTALLIALHPLPLTPLVLPPAGPETRARVFDSPVVPPPPLPILRPVVHAPQASPAPVSRPAAPSPMHASPIPIDTSGPSTIQAPPTSPTPSAAMPGSTEATIEYANASPPAYPLEALRQGIEGTVLLRVLVDANGIPRQVIVAQGSGSRLLDQAAREHVLAAWRFHPAQRDGHAIEAWAQVPVEFKLGQG
ncbi:MAG: TonB family protein [Proteobacteria bacterium]|nr:TonB family protein [Pseudomonadota bacterium]